MNNTGDQPGMAAARHQEWRRPARMDCLPELLADAEAFLAAAGWALTASHPVLLAIEELATNTIKYGYSASAPGTLEVELTVTGGEADLTLRDDGTPFDPVTAAPPDLGQSVDERPIGGLGLHLVRRQSARFDYRRLATGHNEVHLMFRLPDAQAAGR